MTDEQIKVLEAMRLDRIMRVQDKDRSQRIKEEGDALTAALDFIRDMRELEAAAEKDEERNKKRREEMQQNFYNESCESLKQFIRQNRRNCWESAFHSGEYAIGENKLEQWLRDKFWSMRDRIMWW